VDGVGLRYEEPGDRRAFQYCESDNSKTTPLMNDLSILPDSDSAADNTPLPLIVAKRWNFPLAFVETTSGNLYLLQDWFRGLTGENDIRYILFAKSRRSSGGRRKRRANCCKKTSQQANRCS
jgi:hypothetical protein